MTLAVAVQQCPPSGRGEAGKLRPLNLDSRQKMREIMTTDPVSPAEIDDAKALVAEKDIRGAEIAMSEHHGVSLG